MPKKPDGLRKAPQAKAKPRKNGGATPGGGPAPDGPKPKPRARKK